MWGFNSPEKNGAGFVGDDREMGELTSVFRCGGELGKGN